jgi:hypothetical protein
MKAACRRLLSHKSCWYAEGMFCYQLPILSENDEGPRDRKLAGSADLTQGSRE